MVNRQQGLALPVSSSRAPDLWIPALEQTSPLLSFIHMSSESLGSPWLGLPLPEVTEWAAVWLKNTGQLQSQGDPTLLTRELLPLTQPSICDSTELGLTEEGMYSP